VQPVEKLLFVLKHFMELCEQLTGVIGALGASFFDFLFQRAFPYPAFVAVGEQRAATVATHTVYVFLL
jgi:hypothetical protein